MSKQIQFRRGTATEHNTFTGAAGELTVDTTTNTVRVHDGLTPGGTPLARADSVPTDLSSADYVVAYQSPTAENNYSWYRRYKSGWIEQGGRHNSTVNTMRTITLPVAMSNTNYCVIGCIFGTIYDRTITVNALSETKITAVIHGIAGDAANGNFSWTVSGVAA